MATRRSIQVNFRNAKTQAKTLSECASDISRLQRDLNGIIAEISRGWEGNAARAYLAKCEQMKAKLGKQAQDLNNISNAVSRTAQSYYNAEMRAIEIAEARNSSGGGRKG